MTMVDFRTNYARDIFESVHKTYSDSVGTFETYIPISVNGTKADNTGNISLTIPTVVDTVADGNMNAVTSNALYDIVGDIETLLAEL